VSPDCICFLAVLSAFDRRAENYRVLDLRVLYRIFEERFGLCFERDGR
jgi:hypothetical protein